MAAKKGSLSISSENIFPIIKKWVYSDHDIFVREMISNGCDAITKLKKLDVMGEYQLPDDYKPAIKVEVNPEEKTLKFIDNGLGMTADEVEEYITQIAFSGATEFLEKYKDKTTEDDMIGHFGLGFYSAFMVADEVHIDTLSYKEGAKPVHWVSQGGTEYEMDEGSRTEVGSTMTLYLNDDSLEFANEYRVREVLEKYCSFMPVEIFLSRENADPEYETIDEADLKDVRRIAAALSDILTEFQSNAIPSANSFGISYASQSLSASLYIGERITGITCWEAVRKMSEADPTEVSAALEHVYRKTFARSRMIIHISAEKEDIPNACKAAMALRSSLPEGRMEHSYAHVIPGFPRWTGFSVPSQVSFVSMAGRGASFTSAESPADKMLLSMLSSTVLWQRIREKGGAYGAGIALDPIERCWYFYSYRDPRIDGTIDDMLTALDGFSFDEESLSDALIGELSRLVKPVAPSSKAMLDLRRIVYSIKDEDRKLNLCRTLSLTADDISQAADRFRASLDDFCCTVIGGGKAIGESVHPFIIKSLL